MTVTGLRILVTGGAGFLGSHLCEALLNAGHRVVCVDNFSSGHRRNVAALTNDPGFSVVEHDVEQPLEVEVDRIYNLACPASPIHYQSDPLATMRTCIYGASNLLDLADRNRARILQASTSEVYGDPLSHPQRESDWGNVNPNGIRACYDEGKRAAEAYFFDHRRVRGTGIKVARIFNTYGPRMHPDDGRVVSNFIVQALRGEPLTVYGDGSQTRSFCYYSDLIDGLVRLMSSDEALTGPINLGNPAEFTIMELAEMVRNELGSGIRIEFRPLPGDDPCQRRPDISLAARELGWQPTVALAEGLKRTIAYFDAALSASRAVSRAPACGQLSPGYSQAG